MFGSARVQASSSWISLAIAMGVVSLWAISLAIIFTLNLPDLSVVTKGGLLLWQTFLYTGLFVTAHDAMHGAIYPQNQRLNDAVGTFVLVLYGLFSFRELQQRHAQHHQFPASEADPDYHLQRNSFWAWYGSFMTRYWSWKRFLAMVLSFHIVHTALAVPEANLAWGWVYPSILSSLHLFYFGTYLPHRKPALGYLDPHRSTTIARPWLWSLLACYHFGYHHEHHDQPHVPWWQLPNVYRSWI